VLALLLAPPALEDDVLALVLLFPPLPPADDELALALAVAFEAASWFSPRSFVSIPASHWHAATSVAKSDTIGPSATDA
jgi:hypothetical protein